MFTSFNRQRQCRHGAMLYNQHDVYIGRSLDVYGEFSEGEIELFRQVVRPGMTVVEAGANIGAHTLFLAQAAGVGGQVLAFEPQRLVFQTLCANLALNSVPNVRCWQAAVGSQTGEIVVPALDHNKEQNFGGLGLGQFQQGERVPLLTLDGLNLVQCHLLKVDVEGMEQAVLEGASRTIARCQPVLYVENDREEHSAELVLMIDRLGYRMYWHEPPLFNPQNFAGNPNNIFGTIISRNMLCCPKSRPQDVRGLREVVVPS